jgi:ABC-type polysaccharide/polyol phosphate transport system ATPase subunit
MTPTLVFEGVWKRFRRGRSHDSLRDLIPAIARRVIGRATTQANSRDFWAIRDLSFEVTPGEVLGIIGGNGAGKSTTLKILNRIMEPTAGVVHTTGKIGAVIEVSAGFHQDLTGRQNVFLQGAIMGMRKAEVERKFDEIVEFSGIGDFLDTPVKRYSSGMNARLGFSIAAHLEPDILIIDEVLAVGDAAFQAKAFARIKAMATAGAPVVLVSHQLDRITELCTKVILLDHGAVRAAGTAMHCINEYLHGLRGDDGRHAGPQQGIRFDRILAPSGLAVVSGEDLTVVVGGTADIEDAPRTWIPAFRIVNAKTGMNVHSVTGFQRQITLPTRGEFEYQFTMQMNVPAGRYNIEAFIWDAETNVHAITGPALQVQVLEGAPFYGAVQMNSRWSVIKSGAVSTATSKSEVPTRQTA